MATLWFTKDEKCVLDAYFAPSSRNSDYEEALDRLEVPEPNGSESRIDAAVGQILVQSFQDRLPNCGFCEDGKVVMSRKHRPRVGARKLSLVPQHLFTINWADSAPGISWPEAYNTVFVPGYDRHVLIASQDSPDVHGSTDQALGSFPRDAPLIETASEILRDYWRSQFNAWDQSPWAYLFAEGLVATELAESWRDQAWGPEDDEDEVDCDDESTTPEPGEAR